MIVAVSTSSPCVGVALLTEDARVIGASSLPANMASSGACLAMLQSLLDRNGLKLADATLFAADLGPGSFTGVKVGVTLAKTWAFALDVPVTGAESFDLIDPCGTVAIPSKRGEFFIRRVGADPCLAGNGRKDAAEVGMAARTGPQIARHVERAAELPDELFTGFGPGIEPPVYPAPERFAALLAGLPRLRPEELVPHHMMEPSISQPKKPYAFGGNL